MKKSVFKNKHKNKYEKLKIIYPFGLSGAGDPQMED